MKDKETIVTKAAECVAERLHSGQVDKGGKDYFSSHLMKVGAMGRDWKEVTVGLLHDAAEDTPHTVEEVVEMLREKVDEMMASGADRGADRGAAGCMPSEEEWAEKRGVTIKKMGDCQRFVAVRFGG